MPTRYIDEPEYGRDPRSTAPVRDRDPRRDNARDSREPRDNRPDRRPMDLPQSRRDMPRDRDMHMDEPMDLGNRNGPGDARANTTAQRIGGAPRGIGVRPEETLYEDTRTGQIYRQEPWRPSYQEDYNDLPQNARPIVDPGRERGQGRPQYNDYFLPGEGIDREVIQTEICKFLGQDATCRPGTNNDGRRGYIIRAYRALTTEMIRSLKEDSAAYLGEKEKAARRNQRAVPYAQMRDANIHDDEMMMDDEPQRPSYLGHPGHSRLPEPESRLPNRLGQPPITSSYMEPGFPAPQYPLGSAPPVSGLSYEPRYAPASSGTPPHPGRPSQPGYSPSEYAPGTTRPPTQSIPANTYRDPRTGNIVNTFPYPPDTAAARRHRS